MAGRVQRTKGTLPLQLRGENLTFCVTINCVLFSNGVHTYTNTHHTQGLLVWPLIFIVRLSLVAVTTLFLTITRDPRVLCTNEPHSQGTGYASKYTELYRALHKMAVSRILYRHFLKRSLLTARFARCKFVVYHVLATRVVVFGINYYEIHPSNRL